MKKMKNDPDVLEEYDFSRGIRIKYAERYKEGTAIVLCDQKDIQANPKHKAKKISSTENEKTDNK